MAYAESTVGGTSGSQFRVWINSIRTFSGNAAQNYEQWRAEGGVKRVSGTSRIWNLYNNSTYNVQLGLNGVTKSGSFSYDFPNGGGGSYAWGTGTTTVNRSASGGGFGFQSRMDINMNNSPYLTSGWVTSNDSISPVNRYGDITAISPSAAAGVTDETPSVSVDWFKYVGRATLWFRLDQINNSDTTYRYTNVSQDPFIWSGFQTWVQQSMVNTNSTTLYIYYGDDLDSNGTIDRWDTANTRTLTIANESGQANPTFSDFDYIDNNATTVAVTGNDQILIQGKSDLEVTVAAADKATPNKNANMVNYNFSIGGYSQSEPWSNTLDVFKDIGVVADVSGNQNLAVRAVDSRGNSTTVTKNVTVLPYFSPGFYAALDVNYANDFDIDDGLVVNLFNDEVLGSIAPMTYMGSDINEVPSPAGLRFDVAKDTGAFTGTWTNISFTQQAETGYLIVDPVTLASSIESKINSMTADNTVRWHILFEVTDALETQYFTATIDVGRPFFRIGADGRLYYKEIEFFQTFSGESSLYYPALLAGSTAGTWAMETPPAARAGGWAMFRNTSAAVNDECYIDLYVPAGTYSLTFLFDQATTGGLVELNLDDQIIFTSSYNTAGAAGTNFANTGNINFLDGATYRMYFRVTGNSGGSSTNSCRLLGVRLNRIGFIP
jgi:hypothetical protein